MEIKTAKFVISNTNPDLCPSPNINEYAFVGRSNVGKSSLINMLCGQKNLSKTSGRPGKTRLINHFIINDSWYLVDLPGYGYAKASKTSRKEWQQFIRKYILNRKNLICLFVLIDLRIPPQELDLSFMQWLSKNLIPFVIVFTKADKLTKNMQQKNLSRYKSEMLKSWEEMPLSFISSAINQAGKNEILEYIDQLNKSLSK